MPPTCGGDRVSATPVAETRWLKATVGAEELEGQWPNGSIFMCRTEQFHLCRALTTR